MTLRSCVVIVQHEPNDGPCNIARFFEAHNIDYCIFEMPAPSRQHSGSTAAAQPSPNTATAAATSDEANENTISSPLGFQNTDAEASPSAASAGAAVASAATMMARDYGFTPRLGGRDAVSHAVLLPTTTAQGTLIAAIPGVRAPRTERRPSDIATLVEHHAALRHWWTPVGLRSDAAAGGCADSDSVEDVPSAWPAAGTVVEFAVGGVVVLGGFMSANDALPHYRRIFSLIRAAVLGEDESEGGSEGGSERRVATPAATEAPAKCVPYLGICLGMQMLVSALGGATVASTQPELGWLPICVAKEAASLLGVGWPFRSGSGAAADGSDAEGQVLTVLETHGEMVKLPPPVDHSFPTKRPQLRVLARSAACGVQLVQLGERRVVGTQFHPEVDEAKLRYYMGVNWPGVVMRRDAWEEAKRRDGTAFPSASIQCVDDVLGPPETLRVRLSDNEKVLRAMLTEIFLSL